MEHVRGKGQRRSRRDVRLWHRYGITEDQYNAMSASQGGVCVICKSPPGPPWNLLVIEHDHATGKVRGLTCQPCNIVIGMSKESPETLEAVAAYLRRHQET